MDFSKPVKAPGTRVWPPDIELPGVGGDETGAGSDFFIWDNVLPESPGQAHSVPSPMTVHAPGIDLGTSLAAQLHWNILAETDHEQVEIKIGESVVGVDREMATLIKLLNEAGIATATSCIGKGRSSAYVMYLGTDSAELFSGVWQRYLVPLGYPMPELEFTARDEEWRLEIGSEYPFPQPVPVDSLGLTFTCVWRCYPEDMIEILPQLTWALRNHLRGSAGRQ